MREGGEGGGKEQLRGGSDAERDGERRGKSKEQRKG